jgi:uncharacterized membrane protein YhiD involved in acid resistance
MDGSTTRRPLAAAFAVSAFLIFCPSADGRAHTQPEPATGAELAEAPVQARTNGTWQRDIKEAMIRLPIAALLGAALALRPRRRGTPIRTPVVVQTQIILAVVGAVIMLVVGASLARAFGIVGAANLIRYRSNVDDPKSAGVMLCCLAVGLASGVGLYALALFSTAFLVAALAVIESFEPRRIEQFELSVTISDGAAELRPGLERVLRRFRVDHSLRTASSHQLAYDVKVPYGVDTERITNAVQQLNAKIAVTWEEKKASKGPA